MHRSLDNFTKIFIYNSRAVRAVQAMSGSKKDNVSGTLDRITRFAQHAYIRIETLCGKTGWEIHEALTEACGSDTVGFTTVKRWCKLFLEGRTQVVDEERSGRPSDVVIVETMLDEDRWMTMGDGGGEQDL